MNHINFVINLNIAIFCKMKNTSRIIFLLFFAIYCNAVSGQENCKVLKPALAGTYSGKCKNGLAHGKGSAVGVDKYEGQFVKGFPNGKGTYTWASGDTYTGEWKAGKRDGLGDFSGKIGGVDSVQSGVWLDDVYKGSKPKDPEIRYKTNVDRYSVKKTGTDKNRVQFDFIQNGSHNSGITNLILSTSSGQECKTGQLVGYNNISFPVIIKIMYSTPSKLQTATVSATFEIEVFEPGDWLIELVN